ncbi:hypothetical protein COV94_04540, partial [Candidatus Woesearchaeota archaeon CG11_big_fil_rev_8_21_14_0_20_57_5]
MATECITIKAKGMHCPSCEHLIERALRRDGVSHVRADYATELVEVAFDPAVLTRHEIYDILRAKGYHPHEVRDSSDAPVHKPSHNNQDVQDMVPDAQHAQESSASRSLPVLTDDPLSIDDSLDHDINLRPYGLVIAIIGLFLMGYYGLRIYSSVSLPALDAGAGLGLIFVVGLLTGFHCIGMCGGFVVGYSTRQVKEGKSAATAHAQYALGKTLSYTVIGGLFGLLGSFIAFTPALRGWAAILAGFFLVIYGLNMLNVAPWLRRIRIPVPKKFARRMHETGAKAKSPLVIGLLNGLMIACGPLQAMYILAAGTGSMVEGAKMLLVFGLGTLPVLLGFGFVTTIISRQAT